ncbi:hypothetical protein AYI68_g2396 [Smittium mucronatum]|uniref:Uncharacterized protein n=1 Tax=Smittium mucronatum TaxID=133383 RepID=A0A1R0H2S2_9FUNG|nr:hypothetical protein AYI68_g2396 [Smittium mucronatum]
MRSFLSTRKLRERPNWSTLNCLASSVIISFSIAPDFAAQWGLNFDAFTVAVGFWLYPVPPPPTIGACYPVSVDQNCDRECHYYTDCGWSLLEIFVLFGKLENLNG